MQIFTDPVALNQAAIAARDNGKRIGFVPTMGFLHRGHTSLMTQLRPRCDLLIVSIYVNEKQFGPDEDLDRYPRDPEGDLAKCEAAGVDWVFMPSALYPEDFRTQVSVSGLKEGLCGGSRPVFFDGIATVVARLFGLTRCHVACFGEKDYQQLLIVRQLSRDLALGVEVVGGALVRDDDGLALSSRNKYLSAEERTRALTLSGALRAMREAHAAGETDAAALIALGRGLLDVDEFDYLELRDASDLTPLTVVDRPARALVGCYIGKTRLIDNMAVG